MRTVVCVKKTASGELNPFDACALEAALNLPDNEIILLSMAPESSRELLLDLTRLGAQRAVLLCDKIFAGSDTLATSYILSLAIKKLSPDLVLCGRINVDGDTGQVGVELAQRLNLSLFTSAMGLKRENGILTVTDRENKESTVNLPALITVERYCNLRLPRLRSKTKELEIWDNSQICAEKSKCGLDGSPTVVVQSYENTSDTRRCEFIDAEKLKELLENPPKRMPKEKNTSPEKLKNAWAVGDKAAKKAEAICDNVISVEKLSAEKLAVMISEGKPDAVLWESDAYGKITSARVAAMLSLGLCADCTGLTVENGVLYMLRPAFAGNITAKIKSRTAPAMATVRTPEDNTRRVILSCGMGGIPALDKIRALGSRLNAPVCASRRLVDKGIMPYSSQVGLTGKSVNPDLYVCFGISGAVHHIAGMKSSGTVAAVNSDKNAPIFKYADFGIVDSVENIIEKLF